MKPRYRKIKMMTKGSRAKLKCVLVGDAKIGKSSIFKACLTEAAMATGGDVCDSGLVDVTVNKTPYRVTLFDTSGDDGDVQLISELAFPNTDVFVLCYSVVHPTSLTNIERVWLDRIARYRKKAVTVLVGLRTDQRVDATQNVVSYFQAKDFAAKHGLTGFTECCSFDQNRTELFKEFLVRCYTDNGKDQCCVQ